MLQATPPIDQPLLDPKAHPAPNCQVRRPGSPSSSRTRAMSQVLTNSSLATSLAEARERFIADDPRSRAAHLEATAVMPGGNTRTVLFYTPFPLTMIRGS